jgi:hypothetical protein
MDKDVCVGMPQKSFLVGDLNAAEDKLSALDKSVAVKPETYSHFKFLLNIYPDFYVK